MKKFLAKIAITATIVAPFAGPIVSHAATTWDTTGSYVIAFNYLGTDYAHDMSLVQDGTGAITGTGGGYPVDGPYAYEWVIDSGLVTGDSIHLDTHYTVGVVCTMTIDGIIASNGSMSGTWSDNCDVSPRGGTWASTSGAADVIVTNTTIVVSGNTSAGENQPGWLFNRDVTTATPYMFTTAESSIGTGSLYVMPIGATAADKFIAENFLNAPIANVDLISYDFMIASTSLATQEEHFYMNVYANFGESADDKFYDCRYNIVPTIGSNASFTTVTFDPTQAYPVTTRGGASISPYTCPAVPADMDLLSPGSNIRAFALNVGDTSASDLGLNGYLDNVVVLMGANQTTYDFEPAPVVAPGPTNKDQCKDNGWMTFTNPSFKNQGQCVSYTNHL